MMGLKENGSLKKGYRMDNAAMRYDVPPEELDTEFSSFFYAENSPQILSKENLSKEEREILEREDREEEARRRREKRAGKEPEDGMTSRRGDRFRYGIGRKNG